MADETSNDTTEQTEGTSPGTPTRRSAGEGQTDSPQGEHVEPARRFRNEADLRGHVYGDEASAEGEAPDGDATAQSGDEEPVVGDYSADDVPENAGEVAKWISDGASDEDKAARARVAMDVEGSREGGVRATVKDRADTYLS